MQSCDMSCDVWQGVPEFFSVSCEILLLCASNGEGKATFKVKGDTRHFFACSYVCISWS